MLGEKMGVTVVKLKERLYFPEAFVKRTISALQDKTALENNSTLSVRIPDLLAGEVSPGDKLFLGEILGDIPYEKAYTVTSVRYNIFGGSISHIRLVCS